MSVTIPRTPASSREVPEVFDIAAAGFEPGPPPEDEQSPSTPDDDTQRSR